MAEPPPPPRDDRPSSCDNLAFICKLEALRLEEEAALEEAALEEAEEDTPAVAAELQDWGLDERRRSVCWVVMVR